MLSSLAQDGEERQRTVVANLVGTAIGMVLTPMLID